MMKKLSALLLLLCFMTAFLTAGCDSLAEEEEEGDDKLYIYSWGDYLDPDVIAQFEEETGIHVVLDEFDTNESMYPRVKEGATNYDLICPSDYMIQKMAENDLLQPLDYDQLPNAKKYIGEDFLKQAESYDPGNRYSIPYCWGTVGLMYNKKLIHSEDGEIDSWSPLFDPAYKDEILMQDSARDAFMIPLRLMGDSMNTKDPKELEAARDMLIASRPTASTTSATSSPRARPRSASSIRARPSISSKPIQTSHSVPHRRRARTSGWTAGSSRSRPSMSRMPISSSTSSAARTSLRRTSRHSATPRRTLPSRRSSRTTWTRTK